MTNQLIYFCLSSVSFSIIYLVERGNVFKHMYTLGFVKWLCVLLIYLNTGYN